MAHFRTCRCAACPLFSSPSRQLCLARADSPHAAEPISSRREAESAQRARPPDPIVVITLRVMRPHAEREVYYGSVNASSGSGVHLVMRALDIARPRHHGGAV